MPAHPRHPHLPEGREPGRQSERRTSNRRFGIVALGGLAGAGFIAGVLLLAGVIENDDPSTTGAILLALAVFFALLVALVWRLGTRSRGLDHLGLTSAEPHYSRGERVQARLQIRDGAAVAAQTEAGLVCVEYYDAQVSNGRGGSQRGTHEAVVWETWQAIDPGQTVQEFTFELPAAGPYSHEGDALSLAWKLSVREPQRGRPDPRTDEPVWVYP